MTEAEWLACADPQKMLELLRGKASDRKLRLFGCASCRRFDTLLSAEERKAVDMAEAYAECEATADEFANAFRATWLLTDDAYRDAAGSAARHTAFRDAFGAAEAASCNADAAGKKSVGRAKERAVQAGLLRDIFGNPFRPVSLDPAWRTPTVTALARAAYEERILPAGHLEPDRLAILADAFEDAGCGLADILSHCRGPGPHVRGCWVIDLLLEKE